MANARLSKEKQAMVLAALAEGTPINAVCRMFAVGKHAVLRVIEETGEALIDYMGREFRDLPCERVAMELLFSFMVGRRDWNTCEDFIRDAAKRVSGPVQIATDPHRSYASHIPAYFGERASYGTDKKVFSEGDTFKPELYAKVRKNGVKKIVNDVAALDKFRAAMPIKPTRSAWIVFVIRQYIEANRRRDLPGIWPKPC